MQVIKRDGRTEAVAFDKITARIRTLCWNLDTDAIDPVMVTQKIVSGLHDQVRTIKIDELAAETAAYLSTQHPDYSTLAARIAVSNLHKQTDERFSDVVDRLWGTRDEDGAPRAAVSDELRDVVARHRERLDAALVHERDFEYDFFGFKTLHRAYLLRIGDAVVERPQHMLMRIALGIHGEDVDAACETYDCMSRGFFTHATPTMFNAGTPHPQMSSCFLLDVQSDSIEGIFKTVAQCAAISKCAGGIGLSVTKIRANGARIRRSGGTSNGLVPMLRVFDATARYVDQGGGKRPGAFAVYLEPWHADIFDFLELRKNHGKEEVRARDLFYALWIPDLFMARVEADGEWALFCPHEAPGLDTCHGRAFDELYALYEARGKARRVVRAQELWFAILDAQIETGTPYMLYKDAANRKSNQRHLGTLRCSNLCTEIIEYTSPSEVAVCNLASVSLPACVRKQAFDHEHLVRMVRILVRNLNRVIDRNEYPVPEARASNLRHRPIGIGVQGLADAFLLCRLPFDSAEAAALNRDIFETIYFGALTESCALAREQGAHASHAGSPASCGELQFDLWGATPSDRYDWAALRRDIAAHGLRNSLLVAPMPTASTAQILGNNECFEPYTSNLYTRRVLAGEFAVVNRHLLRDLMERGLWSERVRHALMADNGSVQRIDAIPDDLKALYKTAYEIKQKVLIDMAVARGPFICQSQSLNLFVENITATKLSSMHFYGWRQGLKTGMYYLRSRAATDAVKFTLPAVQPQQPRASDAEPCASCSA